MCEHAPKWGNKACPERVVLRTSAWSADACYLQDLFVDEAVRGQGVARALIEQVAQAARERGAPRFYWLTHQNNATARTLYDKVAQYKGFIRYDYPMLYKPTVTPP